MDNKNKLYHVFEVYQDWHQVVRLTETPVQLETNWQSSFQKDENAVTRLVVFGLHYKQQYLVVKLRYYADRKMVLDIVDIDGRIYLVEYDVTSKMITQCIMSSVNRRDVKPSNTRLKALLEICVSYAKKSYEITNDL